MFQGGKEVLLKSAIADMDHAG